MAEIEFCQHVPEAFSNNRVSGRPSVHSISFPSSLNKSRGCPIPMPTNMSNRKGNKSHDSRRRSNTNINVQSKSSSKIQISRKERGGIVSSAASSRVQFELLHQFANGDALLQVQEAVWLLFEEAEHYLHRSSCFFWAGWCPLRGITLQFLLQHVRGEWWWPHRFRWGHGRWSIFGL